MNFKNLLARMSGAEADIKELKKIRSMAAKLSKANAKDEEKEDEDSPVEDEKDEDEDKSKKGKKSGKSESEGDDEPESEKDESSSEGEDEKDDDDPSASAIFEALISENNTLRAENKRLLRENSSESRTKQINAEAARVIASNGHRSAVKTKVSPGGASGKKTVTRAEFQAMGTRQRGEFFKAGGKISE